MKTLRSVLEEPAQVLGRLKVSVPEPSKLRAAVRQIPTDETSAVDIDTTSDIQIRLSRAVESQNLNALSRRDLREGCKTLFHPPLAPGRKFGVIESVFAAVDSRRRRSAFLALINAYLDGFAEGDNEIAKLGALLGEASERWPWRSHDPWPKRITDFRLFRGNEALAMLAHSVLKSELSAEEILEQAGLESESRRLGGMGLASFVWACRYVEEANAREARILQRRLIDWACGANRRKEFKMAKAWPQFAGALFLPWAASPPTKDHQNYITQVAIDYAGDPRTMSPRWRLVQDTKPEALRTIKRWLVRASVLQFFEVVDSVAMERMWRYRRAFWKSYVEAEHVDDAWMVLGSEGASQALAIASQSGDPALRQFGKLRSGGGRAKNHACLMMRIGDLTIAEWSHNGRCYIWNRAVSKHPTLGHPSYHPDELAHPISQIDERKRIGIPHLHAETLVWQRKVARHIADATGLQTPEREWVP